MSHWMQYKTTDGTSLWVTDLQMGVLKKTKDAAMRDRIARNAGYKELPPGVALSEVVRTVEPVAAPTTPAAKAV